MSQTTTRLPDRRRARVRRVPDATPMFWVTKLATTAFGEAFSDFVFFNDSIGQHPAILMSLALLLVCLAIQLRQGRYRPLPYWLTVTAVSIFGTMSADFLNQDLGIPLVASTAGLLVLQGAVFAVWRRSQRTLDVHDVDTTAREGFYWATVLLTFALGTAAGDFVATTLGLGSLASTLVFLALIGLPALVGRLRRSTAIPAFWVAYSLTRPLGASFADWLGVPAPYGDGLQLGTGTMSAAFGVLLGAALVAAVVRHRRATGG